MESFIILDIYARQSLFDEPKDGSSKEVA